MFFTKATRTLCFSFIFIPVLLWISNCLFLNVRCCHIPFVLRACRNLCCICGGTNREVIPVKYGWELTLTRYIHPLQVHKLDYCATIKSLAEWTNAQHVSTLTTMTLPTTTSTLHDLNSFSHMTPMPQTIMYQNIAKILTHPNIYFI